MTTKLEVQNVALVYLEQPNCNAEEEIAELKELIRSAFGKVVLFVSQNRNYADPHTLIGSGKVAELKAAIEACEDKIDAVIFSQQLNALQRKNLQKELEIDVLDNIDLILDIFALRATTAEGKKQVELAQLSYSMATRAERNFSRQGGGIGTRGPGETQLETDKRIARIKMHRLKEELAEIEKQRTVARKKRLENSMFTVALVGYTNAGKSTLFNRITNNNVYADDRLFATLDTTVRKCLVDGTEVLFSDTVGFIKNLPTMLIEAFKSTLEEVKFADLILNVCDASDENVAEHIRVTEEILSQLGVTAPLIRVYNKCDKLANHTNSLLDGPHPCYFISAKDGKNVDALLDAVNTEVKKHYVNIRLKVPYSECGAVTSILQKFASAISPEYHDDYTLFTVTVQRKYMILFSKYLII